MKRYFSFVILAAALALPSMAMAQGSRSTAPKAKQKDFGVTRKVNGKVVAVKAGESLVIETDGARQEFKMARETKTPAGLKKGDAVKVTFRVSDHTATEVHKTNSAT
jgi:hypothetical protein